MRVQRYQVRFTDGRTATVLDMEGEAPATVMAWLETYFRPGLVQEVIHVA